jgi:hypothetical protein
VRSIRLIPISFGLEARLVAPAILLLGIVAWLWPIGCGGMMPLGGDVTQFFLGLMAFYRESLQSGRLPVWNDLWGYGFPGLAESQMGVFYPVHVFLYRWLNTETAYVVSLMFHTIWGGLGAYWAARRMKISRLGSALAAFSWTASGFFLIHLAHPWGYTTACWMPWAWGLGWSMVASGVAAKPAYPFLLALVLALQLLPGHFQLAFLTQFGLVLSMVWVAAERFRRRAHPSDDPGRSAGQLSLRGAVMVLLGLAWAFPLAAIQLVPTARLAQLASAKWGFGYLSDFASPPFHLVNYVAPGLFHRSPLWRPLVWDPFHAMPEEHLAYVGLVPAFLACMAAVREWRRDSSVRLLAFLSVITLLLSLGPYVPGFRYLIVLPGFSFFRAPARWSVATALSLALLAGKGFDRWGEWVRPARSLRRLALIAICWVGATVAIIELALACTGKPGWPEVARGFDRVFSALPWKGEPSFERVLAQARRPLPDPRIASGIPQAIVLRKSPDERVFIDQRGRIYVQELGETAVLGLLVLLTALSSEKGWLKPTRAQGALLLLTMLDLWVLGRHRLIDVAPWKPLAEQSPTLASLGKEPRGTRIADRRLRNLPMSAGLAPISAYRTLDLPAPGSLTALAMGPLNDPRIGAEVRSAMRATGTGLRLIDPVENREEQVLGRTKSDLELIDDPVLAACLFEAGWVAEQGAWARQFSIWRPEAPATRAWFVREGTVDQGAFLDDWSGDPRQVLRVIDPAEPLHFEATTPDECTITVEAEARGWVIITQLADPQWSARWANLGRHRTFDDKLRPAFRKANEPGGWQCIEVPAPGRWALRLNYEAREVELGLGISTIAWAGWLIAVVRMSVKYRRRTTVRAENEAEGAT